MHNFYQIRSDQEIYSGFTCYQYHIMMTMWKQLKGTTGNKIIACYCIPKLFCALEMAAQCKKKIHSTATWVAKMLKRRHIVFCAGSASHSPSSTLAPPVCLCPVGATPPSKWLDDKADLYFQIVQGLSEHPPCTEWHIRYNSHRRSPKAQGGRSCTGARVAPAEKFGLGRKF